MIDIIPEWGAKWKGDWLNRRVRLARPLPGSENARGIVNSIVSTEVVGVRWDHNPEREILFFTNDLVAVDA